MVAVRKLAGSGESRIPPGLGINLKVLADSVIKGQIVPQLEFVLHIEPIIGEGKWKVRIASRLAVEAIGAQGEAGHIKETIRSKKISRKEVAHVGAIEIHPKLEVVPPANIGQLFSQRPLKFFGVGVRKGGVAEGKKSASEQINVGEGRFYQPRWRATLLIAQKTNMKVV